MLASWSPRKADSLKRSLGQLLAREFALIKRYFSFFRRRDRSASKDSARKSARLPETLRRQRNLERADQSSGMPAPAPSTKTQKKDFREKRIKSRKSPRRKGLPTPVPPKRSVPLQREIAHSPADPFASTVGSIVFHMVLLLILIPMWSPQPTPAPDPTRMIIRYIPREDPQQEKAPEVVEVIEAPPPSEEPDEPVDHPDENEIKPVPIDQAIDSATTEDLITANATGGDFAPSRTGGGRTRALASHGGTAETESAIEAGIDWLLRHQARDGSWSPDRFDAQCSDADDHCTGSGYPEHRAGITGLCLLALLGNGHPPTSTGAPREVASWKALQWLLQHQDSTGCIRSAPGESPRNLYDHGIATFALCEAAELMDHPIIENHARKALDFIAQSQQPGGGWDYVPSPTLRNDLSITGWQVLALHAGRKLGDLPPPIVIEKLERYLLRCIDHSGSATYADRGRGRGRGGYGIDAVGLLTRLTLGHSPLSRQSQKSAQKIIQHLPDPEARKDWDREPQSMYYWYTATLALFHMGGPEWDRWNSAIQQHVLPLQHTEGERRGSWDPDPNWLGKAGGRVAQTAMGILTFETYFRYTPLHRQLGFRR